MRGTRRHVCVALAWFAAAWLASLPAEARPVAPGPFDAIASRLARPIVMRPRTTMMWEPIDLARSVAAAGAVNSNVIYLNRCVGGCEIAAGSTNSTADPVRSSLGHGLLSPFSRSDEVWNTVVDCMKDVFAPFNVQITEVDPGAAPHFEIIFGGKPQEIGLSTELGGVAPFSCQPYIPNAVVFVFDVWGDDAEELCATGAQEVAHTFAIDHAIDPGDPMTYFMYEGRRYFKNAQIQCGSDCDTNRRSPLGMVCTGPDFQAHACACGSGNQTQNDFQIINSLFGDSVATPPAVKIVSPRVGDTVEPGFAVEVEISDDTAVSAADLRVDGVLVQHLTGTPFTFTGPTTLADGTHTIDVAGYDNQGTPGRARIQVVVGPGCGSSDDCPEPTDVCIGGRCVAGPDAPGGLGRSCVAATDCKSWQCANADGAKFCVEACRSGQCPSGFGCRDDGQGGGVCWPGFEDDSAGCASFGGGGLGLGLALALLVLRRRRR